MKTNHLAYSFDDMPVARTAIRAGLFGLGLALLVSGCVTKPALNGTAAKAGLACPDCRTILLGPFPSSAEWRGGNPAMLRSHECSGCRGTISAYASGEPFRHECSVCTQTPYSCRVAGT